MNQRQTRQVRIGHVWIGGSEPIAVQSMTATRTQDIDATIRQVELLEAAGADVIRIAVDNPKDVAALGEIRQARPAANLAIDLQENYRLAEKVAPLVQKLRYNPGHLYHIERNKPVREKVRYLVDIAREHDGEAVRPRLVRCWAANRGGHLRAGARLKPGGALVLTETYGNNPLLNALRRWNWKRESLAEEQGEDVIFNDQHIMVLRDAFASVTLKPMGLFSMAKRGMRGSFGNPALRGVLRVLQGTDGKLLQVAPTLGRYCGEVLVVARERR